MFCHFLQKLVTASRFMCQVAVHFKGIQPGQAGTCCCFVLSGIKAIVLSSIQAIVLKANWGTTVKVGIRFVCIVKVFMMCSKPEYNAGVRCALNWSTMQEYNAIRAACSELGDPNSGYCPPITYITVLKRHKARLFPGDDLSRDNKVGNVKPGVVVDDGIALKHGFDFYLNSHIGIQGTVKTAHYHVLCDENNFGSDALQIATYWLCYTFCRCTRSVSYCPPAYYARALLFVLYLSHVY